MAAARSPDTPEDYLVIGTAGHIDHGKTSLIHRLTGQYLDTLPEEQDRKITIALGFTHLPLASGRVAAFVDVPGHERLVRTMVAGATGIDAFLLCVSANEGAMPQTREHLAILELLGVRHGVVALTFADLVDEEMLMLAEEDVRDTLAGTRFAHIPIIPFSSVSGLGEQALVEALDQLPSGDRTSEGLFRLSIDRVFTQRGHGTVITGTVRCGRLQESDEIELLPARVPVRVRAIQVHGQPVSSTRAGLRTAVNLAIPKTEVSRGCELATPGAVPATRVVDVQYDHLPHAPVIEDGGEVRFLVGTAEVVARARPFGSKQAPPQGHPDDQPWSGFLQLQFPEPVACLPGDRYVLRRASPVETLGGGKVLDPWSRPMRHRERKTALASMQRLAAGERGVYLLRAGYRGLSIDEASQRGCLAPDDPSMANTCPDSLRLGDRLLHRDHVQVLAAEVVENLRRFHLEHPLQTGAHRKELAHGRLKRLDDKVLEALLFQMEHDGELGSSAGRFYLCDFVIQLDPDQRQAVKRIEHSAREAGITALNLAQLIEAGAHPRAEELVYYLVEQDRLVRMGPFFAHRAIMDQQVSQVRAWLKESGSLSPSDFKAHTGLTRKHLIPFMEWLDSQRITRRAGDRRWPYRQR